MFSGKIEDYILFEDKEIIVCRKPAGIAVQNARIGAMDLESSLKNYLAMRAVDEGKMPYLAVIHSSGICKDAEGGERIKHPDHKWKDGENLSGGDLWAARYKGM